MEFHCHPRWLIAPSGLQPESSGGFVACPSVPGRRRVKEIERRRPSWLIIYKWQCDKFLGNFQTCSGRD